uniref:NADH-ubiquinone oxidoreductase chain 4L n=1 Tax=Tropidocephala brunnipennis TaxID=2008871 RepID=A0A7S4YZ76_9HEMI|nr:NADH dehydrogenase subunit 4L [Tropidocephala brunnipennis]QBZ38052.1 NADH dehydrogenase subunit 4L [Tropidocephala brunnipennis]
MMISIFYFIFFFSLICMVMVRKHYLLTLMSLELIFLALFFMFFFYLNFFMFEFYFGLIFLILGVCEASLGVSVLVYLVRSVGNDYINNFNLC